MKNLVRVLLIEDDPVFVRIMQETFREIPNHPFSLLYADRLATGLEILTREQVDIVLLDLMLPDSMMLDTLRRVVEHSPQVPIVVLTTLQDEQTGLSAVQMGAQDYLYKGDLTGALLFRSLRYARERKQVEESLKQINRNLHLMNSITRHDVLNQLTVIIGYLHLMEEDESCRSCRGYLEKVEKASTAIQGQIEFTREYQNIGARSIRWQNVQEAIYRAVQLYPRDLGAISFSIEGEDIEIYADPMLEKVFYNLLDNSLRHGGRVTKIRVSWYERDDSMVLIWEDNGIGIPGEMKNKIFRLGVGTNKGLGLFLIRSILGITNMEIRETGAPGEGARFEIQIPRGYFRKSKTEGGE
ncbi:MAG: hybrid sensor histidine kinase/response regulator [Methanomicrobiales archaeon]|nr:hybrid sensor histidine kinase/response regulator [Methanomicrobiales archaeon]